MSSQQASHHTSSSSSSAKHADLRLLTQLSSSPTNSTPSPLHPQLSDPSGPLTPDAIRLGNPFAALSSATPLPPPSAARVIPSVRLIGDYELSETKFDDFKCARHLPTDEALLYKEYPLELVRQRLEPYQRLMSILQSTQKSSSPPSTSVEQLAWKNHLHFFRDILPLERTAIVFYSNYTTNLHQYITEKHRLNESETRNLFAQIVCAIQMCHRVGLIVRDLKLRKIIFNDQTHSHLLLTGLDEAIMLSSPTTADDLVSSRFSCPVYACPEIVLNRQMYSGKMADSWSLGIILYTMLFGRYPFCDRTLVGLFIKIGRCRPDIPRTISLKARSLLRSLIRVKPDERLLTQDILGHVWFGGDRTNSTLAMSTSISNSILTEDLLLAGGHRLTHDDMATREDAVVPNYDCE